MSPIADETTTTSANDAFAVYVDSNILPEVRPLNVSRPFFYWVSRQNANAADLPILDDAGVAAALTEGTGASNTQITTSKATATAGTVGQMATVTDELSAISLFNAYEVFGQALARSVAEKYETDMTALMDDFSNTTSTTGVDLTVDTFMVAQAALAARDQAGQAVAVLHTVQASDLARDIATSTAAYWGNSNANFNGIDAMNLSGYVGTVMGTPIYQTSLIPTANAGADRAGAIFLADTALAGYEIWGPRTETQRDASMPGTEVVVTARYGVVERRDAAGQTIITDA